MERNGKNDWVDKAMHSLDGMQRAEASDALFDRIAHRLSGGAIVSLSTVPKRRIYVAAASVLLLGGLNLYAMLHKYNASDTNTNEVRELAKYYGLTNDNWQDNL
jgi:hypothetical protein